MASNLEQVPFDASDFVDNPEPRCPCVLLLDTSGSMSGEPIAQLNAGLQVLREDLSADTLASRRVEMAVITFGPVRVENEFTTAAAFYPPELTASGDTPMGQAIVRAVEMLRARKGQYRANGAAYFRPWIFLITDGAPTDSWSAAAELLRQGDEKKEFLFFAVGVEGADMEKLKSISPPGRVPLKLRGLSFRELFSWLSNSLGSVSKSNPGDAIALVNPTAPGGWATAD